MVKEKDKKKNTGLQNIKYTNTVLQNIIYKTIDWTRTPWNGWGKVRFSGRVGSYIVSAVTNRQLRLVYFLLIVLHDVCYS